jgi:hypothetical protein
MIASARRGLFASRRSSDGLPSVRSEFFHPWLVFNVKFHPMGTIRYEFDWEFESGEQFRKTSYPL